MTPVETLAIPGGKAGEQALQDQDRAIRQHLKLLLATAKLQSGLIVAALGKQPTADVSAYVARAGQWIDKTTDALAEQQKRFHSQRIAQTCPASETRRYLSGGYAFA
ncbi:MAG: hypothetical protein HC808_20520 [Candidatus Competibacteraceae bacterium]|nr:hypothetical protein [Candidatus Competibacteraceae bacterium]